VRRSQELRRRSTSCSGHNCIVVNEIEVAVVEIVRSCHERIAIGYRSGSATLPSHTVRRLVTREPRPLSLPSMFE
jgi:hypothetical protein